MAQEPDNRFRADESFYFKGRIGLNNYGGDRDVNPFNEVQEYIESIGFSLGLEVGYHFSERFSLGLMHLSGRYPRIEDEPFTPVPNYPGYLDLDPETTSKWRHHFNLVGRSYVLPYKRVTPYGQLGVHLSLGKINDSIETGIGPMGAFGIDTAVSDRIGIFLELNGIFSFGDGALDLADTKSRQDVNDAARGIDASDFDAFTFVGFGLRLNMESPFVPVLVECVAPGTLIPGEAGTFAATINEDATRPVEVTWDFGDGTQASGLLATHAYDEPGAYSAVVTASNRGSTDTAVCPVTVLAPPTCQISAVPQSLSMCQQPLPPVRFTSTVTGAEPIEYLWDFGDGTTSTEANPTHTYTRLDADPTTVTYDVTLRVSNAAGVSSCPITISIESCPCVDIAELGQACFGRNSSVLPAGQAQDNLRNNLEILRNNPSIYIIVEGYASPNERNAQAIAEDRARAVAQFYIAGGIDPSRILAVEGIVQEQAAKTGPICTLTIPLPCDEEERERVLQQRNSDN